MELSIPLPRTPDGRVYRFSPNEKAHPRHFVIGARVKEVAPTPAIKARMKLEPGSKQTVCPYSGMIGSNESFTHPDDIKAAKEIAFHEAHKDVQENLRRVFDGFNSRQSRNSSIRLEAKLESSWRPEPRFYRKDLLRELVCDCCGRDYGVYALALYCPDCGAPNLALHFRREVELVEAQVALAAKQGEGHEELAYRLLGNAHEDVLTGFEATLKTVFLHRHQLANPDAVPPVTGNEFQNIERARRLFRAFDLDPFAVLDGPGLEALQINIQKRHVIGHNLSVADAKFAQHSGDARVGETVRLIADDVQAFAHLAQHIVNALDDGLATADRRGAEGKPSGSATPSADPTG